MRNSPLESKTQSGQRWQDSAGFFFRGKWLWLWGVAISLIVGVLYFALARPIQVLPLIAPAPAFELLDHEGQLFRSFEREEQMTLYSFVPTRDEERLVQLFALLEQAWDGFASEEWADRMDVVLITVDPEYDAPTVWRTTLEQLDFASLLLNNARLTALTGSEVGVKLAVGLGFGVYYEPPHQSPETVEFTYDPRMILVDANGIIRAEYDLNRLEAERLVRDLTLLFTEESAEGISELAYSAAHLFLCYPR